MSNTEHCMSPKNRQLWDIIICYVQHRTLHVPKKQTVNVHDYYAPQGTFMSTKKRQVWGTAKKRQLWGICFYVRQGTVHVPKEKTVMGHVCYVPQRTVHVPKEDTVTVHDCYALQGTFMSTMKRQLWNMFVMSHKEQCMSPKKTLCMTAMPYKEPSCPQRKDNYGA